MQRWQRLGAWSTVGALVFALGFGLGRETDGTLELDWRDGEGHVGKRMMSIEHDGWTYGTEGAVPMWIDTRGSWHDGGWPDCLEPGTTAVRFAAAPTTYVEGMGQRPIIAVDCRGTRPAAD